eukprot:TRINITY_DN10809_c1_g1_i2.p3 TRINITY_DN10809_c1_g1~~TRINITY_DN10809_c1_g1_i2.p3  ORF type:complete len:101 (+),score=14.00 TRINITY_DN10809_c1_g1_i2:124-426(+)
MLWQACFVASSVTNSGSPTAYAKHAWSSFVAAFCCAAVALLASRVAVSSRLQAFTRSCTSPGCPRLRTLSRRQRCHLKVRDLVEVLAKNLLAAVGVSMAE